MWWYITIGLVWVAFWCGVTANMLYSGQLFRFLAARRKNATEQKRLDYRTALANYREAKELHWYEAARTINENTRQAERRSRERSEP